MIIDTLEEVLDSIEKHSIRNAEFKSMPVIDWNQWRENINSYRQSSPHKDDIEILRYALDELHDGHSGIISKETSSPLVQKEPMPFGTMIDRTAYIRLPFCNGENDQYTVITQNIIRQLDHSRPDGWIVDLRINTGGNYRPMLKGIGPLLGNGTHGYLLYPSFDIKETPLNVDTAYPLNQSGKPVAVLAGDSTVSSGEAILITFLKLKHIKIFGEPSAGCSSSNVDFIFQDRRAAFTAGVMADRDKVPYGDKIYPDVLFSGGAKPNEIRLEGYNPASDPIVIYAKEWVKDNANPKLSINFHPPTPL